MALRMANELPKGEGTDYTIYPEPLAEPYRTRRFTWRAGSVCTPVRNRPGVSFHRTVRAILALPDDLMIYSGLALGYEDANAPINSWRSPREPLDAYASFDGFGS